VEQTSRIGQALFHRGAKPTVVTPQIFDRSHLVSLWWFLRKASNWRTSAELGPPLATNGAYITLSASSGFKKSSCALIAASVARTASAI
jgi:hypothetical protein